MISATPLSNDLTELYNIYDLARPGILGTLSNFRHDYLRPIMAASASDACEATKFLGEVLGKAMADVADQVRVCPFEWSSV